MEVHELRKVPSSWPSVKRRVLRLLNSPGRGLVAVRPDGHVGFSCGAADPAGLTGRLSLLDAAPYPPGRP